MEGESSYIENFYRDTPTDFHGSLQITKTAPVITLSLPTCMGEGCNKYALSNQDSRKRGSLRPINHVFVSRKIIARSCVSWVNI